MRRVGCRDPKAGKHYVFLNNEPNLAASTVAQVWRDRWQIELFFKWIKQHLKIKSFLGRSRSAVLSQIWIALVAYLWLAYLKFLVRTDWCDETPWGWRSSWRLGVWLRVLAMP